MAPTDVEDEYDITLALTMRRFGNTP